MLEKIKNWWYGDYEIPKDIKTYVAGVQPKDNPNEGQRIVYEPVKGEKMKVLSWVRYPDYDFIFAVPFKKSPKYEKEIGFLQFRDSRTKQVMFGAYIDIQECKELIDGLALILQTSYKYSPHLWKEFLKKKKQ